LPPCWGERSRKSQRCFGFSPENASHPAKDLAAILEVNANTVLRSLRLLRDAGLLEFRRGRGITVAATPERRAAVQQARDLVALARRHGNRIDELVKIIQDVG
jgi:GntR family transcriptional regulator